MNLSGSDIAFASTSRIILPEQVRTGLRWSLPDVTSREGSPGLKSRGGTPPDLLGGGGLLCDLSHDAFDVIYPLRTHTHTPVKTLPSRNKQDGESKGHRHRVLPGGVSPAANVDRFNYSACLQLLVHVHCIEFTGRRLRVRFDTTYIVRLCVRQRKH